MKNVKVGGCGRRRDNILCGLDIEVRSLSELFSDALPLIEAAIVQNGKQRNT